MRVLVLSQYFWPEPIPKPLELAQALREAGHAVQVITGFPNYPHGNLYEGFRLRPVRRETVGGIPVVRTFEYPSHGSSLTGRMINYASFMLSSIAGGMLAASFDVMYVWHPPLSVGVAAAAICAMRGRGFVYDVQDIWPESAIATGFLRPGRLFDWMARLERFVYARASHILVVTEGARNNLIAKGVPPAKITVAPHWYSDAEIRQVAAGDRETVRAREGWDNRFVVMFAGNMGVLQGLDTVLRASARLPPDSPIVIAMVGDGSDAPRLKALARELGVTARVQFVPWKPAADMARYFAAADALLVHLRASSTADLTIPSKTVAYLAAGKPIVMASTGASASIVSSAAAGIVLPPDDADALAEALVRMSNMDQAERARMGEHGQQYFRAHFTKEATLPTYVAALARVAGASRSRA